MIIHVTFHLFYICSLFIGHINRHIIFSFICYFYFLLFIFFFFVCTFSFIPSKFFPHCHIPKFYPWKILLSQFFQFFFGCFFSFWTTRIVFFVNTTKNYVNLHKTYILSVKKLQRRRRKKTEKFKTTNGYLIIKKKKKKKWRRTVAVLLLSVFQNWFEICIV